MSGPCRDIQKQLTKMHLANQSIEDDPQVQAHLNTCAQCRLHLDRLSHDRQELLVDADSLGEYVDQFKSKVALTSQQAQAKQPASAPQKQDSKTMLLIAGAMGLAAVLYLAWPLLTGQKSGPGSPAPAQKGPVRGGPAGPADASPVQSREEKLAQEQQLAEQLYAAKNIQGLLELLDTGLNQTKQTAAIYLANIGDETTLRDLERRAQAWDANDGINPYTKAITRLQRKMARSGSTQVRSTTLEQGAGVAPTLSGLVQDQDGQTIAGVGIYPCAKGQQVSLTNDDNQEAPAVMTDAAGSFALDAPSNVQHLVVTHDQGVAVTSPEELTDNDTIVLEPWASIRGEFYLDTQPVIGHSLSALSAPAQDEAGVYLCRSTIQTDELGQFQLRVVPGQVSLLQNTYDMRPGQILELHINANERTAKGQLRLIGLSASDQNTVIWDTAFTGKILCLPPDISWADVDRPENYEALTLEEVRQWCAEFAAPLPEVPLTFEFQVDATGTFQVNHVPPGRYALQGQLFDTDTGKASSLLGRVWRSFEIPVLSDVSQLQPLESLGIFGLVPGQLNPGDAAPNFNLASFGPERVILREYRGELVLLSFYRLENLASGDPHVDELASIYRLYGTDAQFAMIGMLASPVHPLITKKALDEADLNWPHALLDSALPVDATTEEEILYLSQQHLEYDVPGAQPWNVLISPDGHILEMGLQGQDLIAAIEANLAKTEEL